MGVSPTSLPSISMRAQGVALIPMACFVAKTTGTDCAGAGAVIAVEAWGTWVPGVPTTAGPNRDPQASPSVTAATMLRPAGIGCRLMASPSSRSWVMIDFSAGFGSAVSTWA
jgi:hypothetical protein